MMPTELDALVDALAALTREWEQAHPDHDRAALLLAAAQVRETVRRVTGRDISDDPPDPAAARRGRGP